MYDDIILQPRVCLSYSLDTYVWEGAIGMAAPPKLGLLSESTLKLEHIFSQTETSFFILRQFWLQSELTVQVNSHPGHADHLLLRVSLDDGLLHHCGQDERELTKGEPEKIQIRNYLVLGRSLKCSLVHYTIFTFI